MADPLAPFHPELGIPMFNYNLSEEDAFSKFTVISDLIDSFGNHLSQTTPTTNDRFSSFARFSNDFFTEFTKVRATCTQAEATQLLHAIQGKFERVLDQANELFVQEEEAYVLTPSIQFIKLLFFQLCTGDGNLRPYTGELSTHLKNVHPAIKVFYYTLLHIEGEITHDHDLVRSVAFLILVDMRSLSKLDACSIALQQLWEIVPVSILASIPGTEFARKDGCELEHLSIETGEFVKMLVAAEAYTDEDVRSVAVTLKLRLQVLDSVFSRNEHCFVARDSKDKKAQFEKTCAYFLVVWNLGAVIQSADPDFLLNVEVSSKAQKMLREVDSPAHAHFTMLLSSFLMPILARIERVDSKPPTLMSFLYLWDRFLFELGPEFVTRQTFQRISTDTRHIEMMGVEDVILLGKIADRLSISKLTRKTLTMQFSPTANVHTLAAAYIILSPCHEEMELCALFTVCFKELFFPGYTPKQAKQFDPPPQISLVAIKRKYEAFRKTLALVTEELPEVRSRVVIQEPSMATTELLNMILVVSIPDARIILIIVENLLKPEIGFYRRSLYNAFNMCTTTNAPLMHERVICIYEQSLKHCDLDNSQLYKVYTTIINAYTVKHNALNPRALPSSAQKELDEMSAITLALHHLVVSPPTKPLSIEAHFKKCKAHIPAVALVDKCQLVIESSNALEAKSKDKEAKIRVALENSQAELLELQKHAKQHVASIAAKDQQILDLKKAAKVKATALKVYKKEQDAELFSVKAELTTVQKSIEGYQARIQDLEAQILERETELRQALDGARKEMKALQLSHKQKVRAKQAEVERELLILQSKLETQTARLEASSPISEGELDGLCCQISQEVPTTPVLILPQARDKFGLRGVTGIVDLDTVTEYLSIRKVTAKEIQAATIALTFMHPLLARIRGESPPPTVYIYTGQNYQPIFATLDQVTKGSRQMIERAKAMGIPHAVKDRFRDLSFDIEPESQILLRKLLRTKIPATKMGGLAASEIIVQLRVIAEASLKLILLNLRRGGYQPIMDKPKHGNIYRDSHRLVSLMHKIIQQLELGHKYKREIANLDRAGWDYFRTEYTPRGGDVPKVYNAICSIKHQMARDLSVEDKAPIAISFSEEVIPATTELLEFVAKLQEEALRFFK